MNSFKEYNKILDKFTKIEKLINFNNENNYKDFNESLLLDYRQKKILIDILKQHRFEGKIFDIYKEQIKEDIGSKISTFLTKK